MIVGLDHAFLTIPRGSEDEARRFYTGLLGLEEIPKPKSLGTPGAWFRAGGQELHLGAYDDHASTKRPHPGFRVGSVTALKNLRTGSPRRDTTCSGSSASRDASASTRAIRSRTASSS